MQSRRHLVSGEPKDDELETLCEPDLARELRRRYGPEALRVAYDMLMHEIASKGVVVTMAPRAKAER